MKLIIDIDEEYYNYAKQQVADGITNPFKIFIASGTPIPDNATNGDVVNTLFSNTFDNFCERTMWEWNRWWRTPYQKGGNK